MHPQARQPLFDQPRHLPRLLPLTAEELRSGLLADTPRLLRLMLKALREERRHGLSGAWHYDAARHRQLLAAFRSELQRRAPMR